jgi:hypothetical protein
MSIVTEYPLWFLIFCVIAGAAYAFVLYRSDKKLIEAGKWAIRLMAIFRFFAIILISFLLLSPLIKSIKREVEKPIIIIAQDNSESVAAVKDSSFIRSEYKQKLETLINSLSNKYEVKLYGFADKIKEIKSLDVLKFDEKQTNIASLFDEVETRYTNRNVGAVIMASDGLYNVGSNPVYVSEKLHMPIYTIALGDTTVKKDIVLSKVEHNRLAYLGNQFPLEIIVNAKQLKGKSTNLTISKGGQNLYSQIININSESFTTTIPVLLEAKEVGLQHYKINVTSLSEETSAANNMKDIYIDVLDARQKILILAEAPHPDIAAIKQSIESNQNYEVESYILDNFDKSLKKYNLVILHSLPNSKNNASKIISEITSNNVPVLAFSGATGILKNNFSYAATAKSNDVEPIMEQSFPLFTISEQLRKAVKDFPAVTAPFGASQTASNGNVLFYQRIGVVDTKTPLLQFYTQNESRIAVFNGEGIWRWRLHDFAVNSSHQLFDELVSKIIQYLSVKVDKSYFKIITKNNFLENENVEFEAELYNESYELINEPEINIVVTNSENKKYPYAFTKTANAYRLDAGMYPVGEYKYQAQVKVADKLYTQNGNFSVIPLQLELTNTTADHQLLYAIANKHNGKMVYPDKLESLAEELTAREDIKSVSYSEKKLDELVNLKWLFFLITILLSAEWFMRKRNGAY